MMPDAKRAANVVAHIEREQAPIQIPTLSVVMPVYNGERYIAEAIASVLAQTHADLELIVVDDGSTDGTARILTEIVGRDSRVRVITQANQGQAGALNRGLAEATTEWVAIHDHDDVSLPRRLERQLNFLSTHPEIRVLGTHAVEIDHAGREIGRLRFGPSSIADFSIARDRGDLFFPPHPSVMFHRPTILALGGYDSAFGSAVDVELWSRVADHHPVVTLPEALIHYRIHATSMSFEKLFEQQALLRWIRRRQQDRRRGIPVPTMDEHRAWERGSLGLRALNLGRLDWAFFALRRARIARLDGRKLHAILWVGEALVLTPRRAAIRLIAHTRRMRERL